MKKFIMIICLLLCLTLVTSCSLGKTASASYEDYTGTSPGNTLGIVMYLAEKPDYKQLKVKLEIYSFGDVSGLYGSDQDSAQAVSEKFVEYCKLKNTSTNWSEKQYYFWYDNDSFIPGKYCRITLFYLIPPKSANDDLVFTFNYTPNDIHYESNVTVF